MRLLVVEESPKLARTVSRGLRHEGYAVDVVTAAARRSRERTPMATHKPGNDESQDDALLAAVTDALGPAVLACVRSAGRRPAPRRGSSCETMNDGFARRGG